MSELALDLKEAHDITRAIVLSEYKEEKKLLNRVRIFTFVCLILAVEFVLLEVWKADEMFRLRENKGMGIFLGCAIGLFAILCYISKNIKCHAHLKIITMNLEHLDEEVDWEDVVDNYGEDNCRAILQRFNIGFLRNPFIGRKHHDFSNYIIRLKCSNAPESTQTYHSHPFILDMNDDVLLHLPKDEQELMDKFAFEHNLEKLRQKKDNEG